MPEVARSQDDIEGASDAYNHQRLQGFSDFESRIRGERGPYLCTQTGIAPSDSLLKTRMFVLRPDGHWVDFNAYASQGKPEAIDEIVFPSMAKVMETFGKLFGRPRVLDLPIDEKGLQAWIERHSSDPLQAARAWVEQYKMRHRKDRGG